MEVPTPLGQEDHCVPGAFSGENPLLELRLEQVNDPVPGTSVWVIFPC